MSLQACLSVHSAIMKCSLTKQHFGVLCVWIVITLSAPWIFSHVCPFPHPSPSPPRFSFQTFVDLCALTSSALFHALLYLFLLWCFALFFSFFVTFLFNFHIYVLPYHCLVLLPAYFGSSSFPSVFRLSFSLLGVCLSGNDHRVPKRRLL